MLLGEHFVVGVVRPEFGVVGWIVALVPRDFVQNGQVSRPEPFTSEAILHRLHQLHLLVLAHLTLFKLLTLQ